MKVTSALKNLFCIIMDSHESQKPKQLFRCYNEKVQRQGWAWTIQIHTKFKCI